jgi:hypothetical protein
MFSIGLRSYKVFENVTEGTLSSPAAVIEVTNEGTQEVKITLNDFTSSGHPSTEGIPIEAGAKRVVIPVLTYNFKATGPIDVVAYIA